MIIKITLEPNRLKTMFTQVMKFKSGAAPLDQVLINFTPNGVNAKVALSSDLMVFAQYNKEFFKSIEVDKDVEQFMTNIGLIKRRISTGFNGETITMMTDEEKVTFSGDKTDDIVTQKLDEINNEKVAPFDVEKTAIGLIPTKGGKKMGFAFSILVPVEVFKDSIDYPHAVLTTNEIGEVLLEFKDETGDRRRIVQYKNPKVEMKETKIIFNWKTFQEIISMFSGEVWISGDETKLVVSQTSPEFSLTYAHAPMKEVP